ncbi:Cysteine dioxygenase 1 [Hondaea fermentalgiana]|uniref:cysteine dioxygenase n=1 Tax=Hondaea fermentalgiana TaxID=2315210 RepID=A0A2R5GR09_9STRA|nr:Cysteine dioxygenase 1 [Hondaea fermentalgiana]|eukprot:GBG30791.1 Cysteine dioxygenase 1 [Hondaea fermentalgiana]
MVLVAADDEHAAATETLADGLAKWTASHGTRDVGEFLLEWFAGPTRGGVEPWMDNAGQVSLVFQNPQLSVVVIRWGDNLAKYGHAHVCERVWSWTVEGKVHVNDSPIANDGVPLEGADHVEVTGEPGALSVHVYQTEVGNMVCHPTKCGCTSNRKLVLCQGVHSVTDAERGASVSRIVGRQKGENVCQKSLRLYTNFRDLIELLHHEIETIAQGEVHSEEHIARISALLSAVRINESEYARYLRFHNKAYTRNLVGYDVPSDDGRAKFTVLILCWDKGQMSPIHDHAGSSCWVKVLQGQVREIRYDTASDPDAPPRVIRDLTLGAQGTCYINDTQGVHSMGNPNPDQVSVSLHVYAPPYVLCRLFDVKTGAQSTGSMATARIPSNPFPWSAQSLELTEFYERVREAVNSDNCDMVGHLVERLVLKEREWTEFVHFDAYRYTRSLVALEADFSLMVLCWNTGQGTPIHTHGTKVCSWVKVLRGSIVLKRYSGTSANPKLDQTLTFSEGDNIDCNLFKGMHMLQNESENDPAVTLHLYSPPFVQMAYLDSAGVDRVIPVVHSATSTKRTRCADPISICDKVIQRSRSVGGSFSDDVEDGRVDELLSFFEQDKDPNVFTNLNALSRFIVIRGLRDEAAHRHVLRALDRMHINPDEWHEFVEASSGSPSQILISRGSNFKLVLRRIDPLTQTPRQRPETCSWIKILSGEVLHSQFLEGTEVHSTTLTSRTAVYVSNLLETSFRNVATEPCYMMQILL